RSKPRSEAPAPVSRPITTPLVGAKPAAKPAAERPPAPTPAAVSRPEAKSDRPPPAPAARKMLEEKGMAAADVEGSGRRGQVLKEDVIASAAKPARPVPAEAVVYAAPMSTAPVPLEQMRAPSVANDAAREERVRMTRLRQTIARRLNDAQNTAAMLTTFNDVDMSAIIKLRGDYKDLF